MANDKCLNHDLPDLNDEHDSETSNHNIQTNQKNHRADNVTPLRLRSSFRIPCQQGVHKKASSLVTFKRLMKARRIFIHSSLSQRIKKP